MLKAICLERLNTVQLLVKTILIKFIKCFCNTSKLLELPKA